VSSVGLGPETPLAHSDASVAFPFKADSLNKWFLLNPSVIPL